MNSITFENRKFEIKEIKIKGIGSRIIATTDLNNILVSIEGVYKSDEARFIDEQIYYFVEPDKFKLKGSVLSKYVEKYCD